MKWFEDVFLSSLYERFGLNGGWLSQKQTSICVQNMECQPIRFMFNSTGDMGNHLNYVTIWNGRKVILSYSKLNGCGCIRFEGNAEEKQGFKDAALQEKIDRDRARFEKHPEALEKRIAEIKGWIDEFIADNEDYTHLTEELNYFLQFKK